MLVLLIMQSNKVMFNHEIKAWTKEELSTSLTFILSDKEVIKANQRKPVLQALAAFIRSTANEGLWSAKQVKNFAEAVDEKIKALAPESSTPEVKTKKDNKPTVGRVVPMKKFKKGKYKKESFVEASFKPSCCIRLWRDGFFI